MEHWKRHPKYPDYEISDHGNCRRAVSYLNNRGYGEYLAPQPSNSLRWHVLFRGKQVWINGASSVLELFGERKPQKWARIQYHDGNKMNCHIDNLSWHHRRIGPTKEQKLLSAANRQQRRAVRNALIRRLHHEGRSMVELASVFDLDVSMISLICNYKRGKT